MTYLQYHLVFIVPLLVGLSLLTWRSVQAGRPVAGLYRPENPWAWMWFGLLSVIALVYTTPWDNYLVYKGIWNYPPDRVLARIGYVPVEEYAFFILQTSITGLWLYWLLRRGGPARVSPRPLLTRWGGVAVWLGLAFAGAIMLRYEQTLYLGLILAWAGPVLAGQWAFGGDLIMGQARVYWWAALPPTLYLWATDLFAIGNGIWGISDRYTLGWNVFGVLPVEEMTFFLITNLLVVTGLMLFLHPVALERVRTLTRHFRPWMGFLALYALLKIPVPLWPAGFPILGTASTVCLFLAGLAFAWQRVGLRSLLMAALAFGIGLGVEVLGSRTGFPFGPYSYAGAPGPLLLGVPLLVPLGWFAMTLSAGMLARGRPWLAGLLLVAWDVGLEPLMTAQGYWTWGQKLTGVQIEGWARSAAPSAIWAGAPIQNFIAWFVVGAGLVWAFGWIAPELFGLRRPGWINSKLLGSVDFTPGPPIELKLNAARPATWLDRLNLPGDFRLAYLLEAAFLPGGLLLFGQYGAALATLIVMGALAGWAVWGGGGRAWVRSRSA